MDFVGSAGYLAPELMSRLLYVPSVADVFSLGVCLYAMLFARFPFDAAVRQAAIQAKTAHPPLRFPGDEVTKVSAECKGLITAMLEVDASKRISLEQIAHHPWLGDVVAGNNIIEQPTCVTTATATATIEVSAGI